MIEKSRTFCKNDRLLCLFFSIENLEHPAQYSRQFNANDLDSHEIPPFLFAYQPETQENQYGCGDQ